MNSTDKTSTKSLAGYTALAGSVCALVGAALWGTSGADLDLALASGEISNYLIAAGQAKTQLVANLTIWICMAVLIGIAGTTMASLSRSHTDMARIATLLYASGVALVVAAYAAWLAIVVQVAPDTSDAAVMVTKTLGWFATHADWIATILVVGIGPTFIALSGRDDWVPNWLLRWSYVTAFAAILNAVAMLTGGSGLSTYGFVIIPVGVGWMIAAGIVLLRSRVPTD